MKKSTLDPLPVILAVAVVALLARLFVLDAAVVQGRSMLPTFRHGEVALVFRAAYGLRVPGGRYLLRWGVPAEGHIVEARNPRDGAMVVKRVGAWPDPGAPAGDRVFLVGDNPAESLDSRSYGPVEVESILGRVVVFPPCRTQ